MSKWKRLDLAVKFGHPEPDELTAIRTVPRTGLVCGSGERFEIGYLQPHPRSESKKLWWFKGNGGVTDLAQLKKRYDIWWCPVATFDGM